MKDKAGDRKPKRKVVRLEDLAPSQDVRGGAGKLVFGEAAGPRVRAARAGRSRAREPRARE
jgi:hypothetical protein